MDTGLFIALLNPAIALALSSAFLTLWLYQRHRSYLVALALAYTCSAVGFLLQYFTLPIGFAPTKLLSSAAFTVAACLLAAAVVTRYGRQATIVVICALGLAGFAAFSWFLFVQPDLTWRIYVINFAFGTISLVVAAELREVRRNGPTEAILFVLSVLAGLNFIVRTLVAVKLHGPFTSYDGFYQSVYWTTALLSHALLALLIALCLFTAAALDVVKALRAESRTDPLSKLLNRRGFEEQVEHLLATKTGKSLPLALVLADLDHFKTVNDRYGHEGGDLVIAHFAATLRAASGGRAIAGRLGGEEFAVLLPAADLAVAQLFAEGVRTSFAASRMPGLPRDAVVTASFGIAVRTGGEGIAPLMRRADDALYKAKRSGRDSVRLSYQRPEPATLADMFNAA
ncbi:sensor domain-containing diguanylate cyclase [Mesorhizobium sp. ZC-5]|uniref:GGDEF domain-containing protein n=1 Tax=Mesorhizobium sp. ZC-5 TaxID=2986066 RepID=UPI0021E7B8B2|nr:GGDEF domain-containing protein [Mesorhizobium sp. ZC-5]MCV3239089.1 GGDEF domain-containing protein [Mesorhizobium sp. ZC-5]